MEVPTQHGFLSIGYTSTGDPDEMVNTFGVRLDGPPTQGDLSELLDAWLACWEDFVSETIVYGRSVLRQSDADGGLVVEEDRTGVQFGSVATAALTTQSAYIVRKTCAIGGRAHRGRIFMPGIPIAVLQDNGNITPTQITNINGALSNFLSLFPIGDINSLQLLHTNPATAPDLITGLQCYSRMGTMRHRYNN